MVKLVPLDIGQGDLRLSTHCPQVALRAAPGVKDMGDADQPQDRVGRDDPFCHEWRQGEGSLADSLGRGVRLRKPAQRAASGIIDQGEDLRVFPAIGSVGGVVDGGEVHPEPRMGVQPVNARQDIGQARNGP